MHGYHPQCNPPRPQHWVPPAGAGGSLDALPSLRQAVWRASVPCGDPWCQSASYHSHTQPGNLSARSLAAWTQHPTSCTTLPMPMLRLPRARTRQQKAPAPSYPPDDGGLGDNDAVLGLRPQVRGGCRRPLHTSHPAGGLTGTPIPAAHWEELTGRVGGLPLPRTSHLPHLAQCHNSRPPITGCPRSGRDYTGLQSTGGALIAGPATTHRA